MTAISLDSSDARVDVLVIGAGPAGLAVGVCLRRAGVPFLILEAGEHVGMSWHAHYDRLHLHTVKRYSALPYMPFPDNVPRYPSRDQVIAYLQEYARRFDLAPRFGQRVTHAGIVGGEWRTLASGDEYWSRYLVVCTGANRRPITPRWDGEDRFAGRILHSSEYRNGETFREQRVLVVGMGNSGAEIALDLAQHGAETRVAVRGGVNIVPRDPLGIPVQVLSIFAPSARPQVSDAFMRPLWRRLIGDLKSVGLGPPGYGPVTGAAIAGRIPVIDVGTVRLLKAGDIQVRGAIRHFTPSGVVFADGREEAFDAVILATGFRPGLNEFLAEAAEVTDARGYPLAHGRETPLPGLYFCGLRIVSTGLLPEIGREARRISRDIAKRSAGARS